MNEVGIVNCRSSKLAEFVAAPTSGGGPMGTLLASKTSKRRTLHSKYLVPFSLVVNYSDFM